MTKGVVTVVSALAVITGIATFIFAEPVRSILAVKYFGDVRTAAEGEALVSALINVASRDDTYDAVLGRRIVLDVTIHPGLDRNWVVPPRSDGKPPSLRLVSELCPNSPGEATYFRLFVNGDDVGTDDFGLVGDAAALRGEYRLSSVRQVDEGPDGGGPSCHVDLALIDG